MKNFKYLRIQGFGAIKKLKFRLDTPGLNLVAGPNGVGKTNVFNALVWVCWGKLLKEKASVETWKHLRLPDYKGVKVELYLEDGNDIICIKRLLNYKGKKGTIKDGLTLTINGKEREDLRDKKDVQAKINEILGFTFSIFKNSVVFGQRLKRLIQESNTDKKKILEEAFDIGYIEQAKKVAEKENVNLTANLSKLHYKITNEQNLLNSQKTSISYELILRKDFKNNVQNTVLTIQKNIEADRGTITKLQEEISNPPKETLLQSKIDLTLDKIQALEKFRDKEFKLSLTLDQVRGESERLVSILENLSNYITPKTCVTCGKSLSPEKYEEQKLKDKAFVKKTKSDLAENRVKEKELAERLLKLRGKVEKYTALKSKLQIYKLKLVKSQKLLLEHNTKLNRVDHLATNIITQKLQLEKEQDKEYPYPNRLNDLRKVKYEIKDRLKALRAEYKEVEDKLIINKWLIKDPLSNSGLKAFIFEQMLKVLNQNLKAYAQYLGFLPRFCIDLSSTYKDFYTEIVRNNEVIPYDDLSGGEKQLVDVSVSFAFHDILNVTNPTNLLIFDEIFESLSANNIEIVSQLIQQKAKSKTVFLITHLDFSSINANLIELELDPNGHTVLVS